jgi:GTP cyclohydrolase IA
MINKIDQEKILQENKENIIKDMLTTIGENPEREGLKDTPKRVVKMWKEIFRGYDKSQKPKVTSFMNGNDGIVCDEMLHDDGSFYSHCEHHMVPFFGHYYFAYIPNPKGKILGLSKVARIVDYYSAKLQIQERLVSEIVKELWDALTIKTLNDVGDENCYKEIIEPLGMALVMDGEHLCKTMRGVKKKGKMRATKLIGTFKTDPAARAELMAWVNNHD